MKKNTLHHNVFQSLVDFLNFCWPNLTIFLDNDIFHKEDDFSVSFCSKKVAGLDWTEIERVQRGEATVKVDQSRRFDIDIDIW